MTKEQIKQIATIGAISHHISNFDEIENAMELYTEDAEGFIENHADIWEIYENYDADDVVGFIETMIETNIDMMNEICPVEPAPVDYTPEQIVALLLGSDAKLDCCAVMIDDDWVGYLSENEDGYDDHDEPILTACNNDDEPFMSITINDLKTAVLGEKHLSVKDANGDFYSITPLTPLKFR